MPVTQVYNAIVGGEESSLRAQENSPVFRLPPEILTIVFIHGARDYHENINIYDDPTFRVPDWVNVSYVCRRWRNIALNDPTLWTYHFIASLRWTEELLARSKQASLKIRVYDDLQRTRSWWSDLLEKLLAHVERIEELRLSLPLTIIPSTLSLRAPRLQILDIEPYFSHHSDRAFTISDGDVSPLHTLRLTKCWLPWHSFNLRRLTTLFLCEIPAPKHSLVDFLAIVPHMQTLIVLYLDYALASARGSVSTSDVSPQTGLPCLARLSIAAPLSTVAALLSCVNIPLKTELRLEFQWEEGSTIHDYTQISSALARRFNQPKDLLSVHPSIRSLSIRSPSDISTFALCLSEQDACDLYMTWEVPEWDSGYPLVIFVEMGSSVPRSDLGHVLSNICFSLPLADVQNLQVTDPPFSSDFWKEVLSRLAGVRCVELSEGFMPDIASSLVLPVGQPVETTRGYDHDLAAGQMLVPALEKVCLYDITFASEDDLSRHMVSEKSLLTALASRKALCPRLKMIGCYTIEDDERNVEDDTTVS